MKVRPAIIGFNSVERLGLKAIVSNLGYNNTEDFNGFECFFPFASRYDVFIISSDVFAEATEFFLPRKSKVAIGLPSPTSVETSVPLRFSTNSELPVLERIFESLFSNVETSDIQNGELSQREIDVVKLIAAGKLNKEIADILSISINTVITHRKNITSKLGIKTASGISLYAMMNGYI